MRPASRKNEEAARLLLTFCAGLALCGVLYAVNGLWPFGGVSVLTGDLNGQYISYFAQLRRSLLAGDGVSYAFTKSLGGSMEGIVAYYAASPFNLLYLLAPPRFYAQLAGVVLALKLSCAGAAFACWAGRHWGLRGWSVPMGLCYAFMAYDLVYAQNIMWHDGVILLPLICAGVDALVRTGRALPYVGWLALAIYANFYIAYMICIFSVLYFGLEMLSADAAARGAAGGTARFWGRRCALFAAGSLCAGLLCGAALLPWLADISVSKGIGDTFAFTWETLFPLRELAQRLWPGNFVWGDVERCLPNIYCGVFAAALALGFFVCRRVPAREKLLWGGLLALLTASFLFRGINLVWHGFTAPVWFPYRNSFLFSFVLLAMACGALARGTFSRRGMALALCLLAALGLWTFLVRYTHMTLTKLALAGAGVLCALALLAASRGAFRLGRVPRRWCAAACAALVVGEVAVNGASVLGLFEKYTVADYQDFLARQTRSLDAVRAADAGDYRVEKTFFRSLNDPMLLGFRGLSHFGSTQDGAVTRLLAALGLDAAAPLSGHSLPTAGALLGVKYLLARPEDAVGGHYVPTGIDASGPVYEDPGALPLAFLADGAAAGTVWAEDADPFAVHNAVYSALTGRETKLYTAAGLTARDGQGRDVPPLGKTDGERVYTFTAPKTGPCYFSLDAVKAWPMALTVNGETEVALPRDVFCGTAYLGEFKRGQTVTVRVELPDNEVTGVCAASFDTALWQSCARGLRDGAQALAWRDGRVSGTVDAARETLLFTSIPWSENWSLTVNGKAVSAVPLLNGTLTGVPLAAGENTILLRYRAPYRGAGLALTALGALGAAALAWTQRAGRRRRLEMR